LVLRDDEEAIPDSGGSYRVVKFYKY